MSRASQPAPSSIVAGGSAPNAGVDFTDSDAIRDWMTLDGAETWRRAWAGNVTTHHFLTAALLPLLDKGAASTPGHSSVVLNIADLAGVTKTHSQGRFAYSAAMAGLLHLTKEWAHTFMGVGVRVNCIAPALIESEMRAMGNESGRLDRLDERVKGKIPAGMFLSVLLRSVADGVGRAGKEQDIASAVLYLCSRAGTYVNGQVINVDGGWYLPLSLSLVESLIV
jgi:NAD(P)-dependent dehydrogenase (short-subunit alcohol dehydrogenase family)